MLAVSLVCKETSAWQPWIMAFRFDVPCMNFIMKMIMKMAVSKGRRLLL